MCLQWQLAERPRHVTGHYPRSNEVALPQPLPGVLLEAGVQVLLGVASQQGSKYADGQHNGAKAHGGTHAGRHPHTVTWHAGHDVFLRIAIEQTRPGTRYRSGQRKAQVAAMIHRPGTEQVAATYQGQTGGHHAGRAVTGRQAGADTRAEQHGQGKRQHPKARSDSAQAQAVLQIERQQGHHHLSAARIGKHAQQGADKARMAKQLQVNHGATLQ